MFTIQTLQDVIDHSQLPEPVFLHIMPSSGQYLDFYQRMFVTKGTDGIQAETRFQNRRNFTGARTIITLVPFDRNERYVFAGAYEVTSDSRDEYKSPDGQVSYIVENQLTTHAVNTWLGRIIVQWAEPTRNRYRKAAGAAAEFKIVEVRERSFNAFDIPFPGFHNFHLARQEFDTVVGGEGLPTWRAALSSVAGVYAITDRQTGDTYVGSAYSGEGASGNGIWGRWQGYVKGGDNGNKLLRAHIQKNGSSDLQYSVLQTMDLRSSKESVIAMESFFKNALGTRVHGLNAN